MTIDELLLEVERCCPQTRPHYFRGDEYDAYVLIRKMASKLEGLRDQSQCSQCELFLGALDDMRKRRSIAERAAMLLAEALCATDKRG